LGLESWDQEVAFLRHVRAADFWQEKLVLKMLILPPNLFSKWRIFNPKFGIFWPKKFPTSQNVGTGAVAFFCHNASGANDFYTADVLTVHLI